MSRLFCVIWEEIKMEESKIICCNCETVIDSDDYEEINGEIYCSDCV